MNPKKLYLWGVVGGLAVAAVVIAIVALRAEVKIDPAQFASWVEVAPESSLFTAAFPMAPSRQTEDIPIENGEYFIRQETHSAEDEAGNAYFVSTLQYPVPFDEDVAEVVLVSALEGYVGGVEGNTLVASRYGAFKGIPAVEFVVQNGTVYHQGKMALGGRVLYQAFVMYEDGALAEAQYVYFLDAITIPSE